MGRKPGRPTIYNDDLTARICVRLAEGESLRRICKDSDMPVLSTVLLWVVDGKHPEFSERYARAREAQGHALADTMLDLHRELRDGDIDDRTARVIQDGLKWQAERLARRMYGQRQEVDMNMTQHTVSSEPMSPEEWQAQYGNNEDS